MMTGGVTATAGLGLYHVHLALEATRRAGERVLDAAADMVETTTRAGGVLVEFTGERLLLVLSNAVEVSISKYMLVFLMLASYAPQLAEAVDNVRLWSKSGSEHAEARSAAPGSFQNSGFRKA
jgi:hypothetical protein